jgi:hypothetical protein
MKAFLFSFVFISLCYTQAVAQERVATSPIGSIAILQVDSLLKVSLGFINQRQFDSALGIIAEAYSIN